MGYKIPTIILVEGMDNTGKTTLVNRLKKQLPGQVVCYKSPGPCTGEQLKSWLIAHFNDCTHSSADFIIFDRIPLVSEEVYGPAIRGDSHFKEDWSEWWTQFLSLHPLCIYVRPPLHTILQTWSGRPQMEGVEEQITSLLDSYDRFYRERILNVRAIPSIQYDFTRDPEAKEVFDFIRTQLQQEVVNMDKLDEIFARQRELMDKYHLIEAANGLLVTDQVPVDLNDPRGQARLKEMAWRTVEELAEAMNELKNRPWKQSHTPTNKEAFREEVVDALHFFIELCILAGFTPQSLHDQYLNKAAKNTARQESKY